MSKGWLQNPCRIEGVVPPRQRHYRWLLDAGGGNGYFRLSHYATPVVNRGSFLRRNHSRSATLVDKVKAAQLMDEQLRVVLLKGIEVPELYLQLLCEGNGMWQRRVTRHGADMPYRRREVADAAPACCLCVRPPPRFPDCLSPQRLMVVAHNTPIKYRN